MPPFRIFDKKTKTTWLIINYQGGKGSGNFLAAREDDSPQDGELTLLSLEDIVGCRMLEFVAESEGEE
jgi:hypothetical protein